MLLNRTAALSNPYPDGCCAQETLPTLQQVLRGLPPPTTNRSPLSSLGRFATAMALHGAAAGLESLAKNHSPA